MIPHCIEVTVERIPNRYGGATWEIHDPQTGCGRRQYQGGTVWGDLSQLLAHVYSHYASEAYFRRLTLEPEVPDDPCQFDAGLF